MVIEPLNVSHDPLDPLMCPTTTYDPLKAIDVSYNPCDTLGSLVIHNGLYVS